MVQAVLFDFYGTLARWRDLQRSSYAGVFARYGYAIPEDVMMAYTDRYDGIEHPEHSTDAATYDAWVRFRLRQLAAECGIASGHVQQVIDDLRAADHGEMCAYPEVVATLDALRQRGYTIGVCSNWGWDLDAALDRAGLSELVDTAVTSAQAGARKPHPKMYQVTLAQLGVPAPEVLFVGDSWGPDVLGPQTVGMAAVHVWRPAERDGQVAPELEGPTRRIADLSELLALLS
ncbi:MAG TPA: HAD family hydrolase [Acidimicrobiales bacterium]